MGITRLRADLQLKQDSVTSDRIKDYTITEEDIAPGTFTGALFVDGSIGPEKLDPSLAGDGLAVNPTTKALELDLDPAVLEIVAGKLTVTSTVTTQGNLFNGPDQLIRLLSDGKIPSLDASNLYNIPGGGGGASFVDLEEPSGARDGVNKIFTLAHIPATGSVHLFFNGILQNPGVSNDFTVAGQTITMNIAPPSTSVLLASYRL